MRYVALEILKLRHRRLGLFLFFVYLFALPVFVNGIAIFGREGPEGTYVTEVALGFLTFSLAYMFLPLWVIVLTGMEFSSGHVHRVVFLTSRDHYVKSKIAFSILTAIFFAGIGIVTLAIAEIFSPYPFLEIPFTFYIQYFFQGFVTFLAFTLFLMCLLFLIRNIVVTYVVYFGWQLVETIIYMGTRAFEINFVYLPLRLLKGLFAHDGIPDSENYFMIFDQWKLTYVGVVLMLAVFLAAAYRYFVRSSLSSLSD